MQARKKGMIFSLVSIGICLSTITPVMAKESMIKPMGYDPANYIYTSEEPGTTIWGIKVSKNMQEEVKQGRKDFEVEIVALAGSIDNIGEQVQFSIKDPNGEYESEQTNITSRDTKQKINISHKNASNNQAYIYVINARNDGK